MRDGLYKVHFRTPIGEGAGVIVLHGESVSGGDSVYFYSGAYQQNNNEFTATVAVRLHTRMPGMGNVFGVDTVDISLTGKVDGDAVHAIGTAAQVPGVRFQAELSRLSD